MTNQIQNSTKEILFVTTMTISQKDKAKSHLWARVAHCSLVLSEVRSQVCCL